MRNNTNLIDRIIDNHLNGNNADAVKMAKRVSFQAIFATLHEGYGWTAKAAYATADFLKGDGSFQAACDAQIAQKARKQ